MLLIYYLLLIGAAIPNYRVFAEFRQIYEPKLPNVLTLPEENHWVRSIIVDENEDSARKWLLSDIGYNEQESINVCAVTRIYKAINDFNGIPIYIQVSECKGGRFVINNNEMVTCAQHFTKMIISSKNHIIPTGCVVKRIFT